MDTINKRVKITITLDFAMTPEIEIGEPSLAADLPANLPEGKSIVLQEHVEQIIRRRQSQQPKQPEQPKQPREPLPEGRPRFDQLEDRDQRRSAILEYVKDNPDFSVHDMATHFSVSTATIVIWLHGAGIKTVNDRIKERIYDTLKNGPASTETLMAAVSDLTTNANIRRGVMSAMTRRGSIKKLGEGQWAIEPPKETRL